MTQLEKLSASLRKPKLRWHHRLLVTSSALIIISGCASTKPLLDVKSRPENLSELYEMVCPSGTAPFVTRVEGAAAFRVKSPEANGKFVADVVASSTGELQIEITNPIGGTEAVIRVSQGVYKIEIPGKPEKTQKGLGYWGGIPLHWAVDLFLGRIPCAAPLAAGVRPRLNWERDIGALRIENRNSFGDLETFDYHFGQSEDGTQLKKLEWRRMGTFQSQIKMTFQEWDEKKQLFKKWSAESKQGEVSVRWQSVERK